MDFRFCLQNRISPENILDTEEARPSKPGSTSFLLTDPSVFLEIFGRAGRLSNFLKDEGVGVLEAIELKKGPFFDMRTRTGMGSHPSHICPGTPCKVFSRAIGDSFVTSKGQGKRGKWALSRPCLHPEVIELLQGTFSGMPSLADLLSQTSFLWTLTFVCLGIHTSNPPESAPSWRS